MYRPVEMSNSSRRTFIQMLKESKSIFNVSYPFNISIKDISWCTHNLNSGPSAATSGKFYLGEYFPMFLDKMTEAEYCDILTSCQIFLATSTMNKSRCMGTLPFFVPFSHREMNFVISSYFPGCSSSKMGFNS